MWILSCALTIPPRSISHKKIAFEKWRTPRQRIFHCFSLWNCLFEIVILKIIFNVYTFIVTLPCYLLMFWRIETKINTPKMWDRKVVITHTTHNNFFFLPAKMVVSREKRARVYIQQRALFESSFSIRLLRMLTVCKSIWGWWSVFSNAHGWDFSMDCVNHDLMYSRKTETWFLSKLYKSGYGGKEGYYISLLNSTNLNALNYIKTSFLNLRL